MLIHVLMAAWWAGVGGGGGGGVGVGGGVQVHWVVYDVMLFEILHNLQASHLHFFL